MSFGITTFKLSHHLKRNFLFQKKYFMCSARSWGSDNNDSARKRMQDFFFDHTVQDILKKITGVDHSKLFAPKKGNLAAPIYEFVTEQRFKELKEKAATKVIDKLQMPPVMDLREPVDTVIANNPEYQGYIDDKLVFIDINPKVPKRERIIVVRHPDGILRTATWEERDRMNQIFFPEEGRELECPKYFEMQQLDHLLDQECYLFILDSACVQFEPDDPEYHRVTSKTYEHIKQKKKFDTLRSTRHFGPMAFYFAYHKNIEPLIIDMVERRLISDAADTIKLLFIINPELSFENMDSSNEIEIVKEYIERNSSPHKADLELAVQSLELSSETKVTV